MVKKSKVIIRKKNIYPKSKNSLAKRFKSLFFMIVTLLFIVLLIDNSTTVIKRLYPIKYKQIVLKHAQENGIDPYLVFAVIKAESSFKPDVVSDKKAMGLMQITEKTALWGAESIGIRDFSVNDLYDPETNIRIGCWYIKQLGKEFDKDINLVLAAYNGGSGNVRKWLEDNDYSKTGKELEIIPYKETDMFVKRVINYYQVYTRLYGDG